MINIMNRHLHLFILLVILLLILPFVEEYLTTEIPVVALMFLAGLTATLWALNLSRRTFLICASIAVVVFIVELATFLFPKGSLSFDCISFVFWLLFGLFEAICIVIMIQKIFSSDKITMDTLIGGINIYMLLAFFWTVIYHLVNIVDVRAFNPSQDIATTKILYYSYSTITTLGMGDIVPVNRYAMIITSLEAVVGQFYVAIFISMLVGLHVTERVSSKTKKERQDK